MKRSLGSVKLALQPAKRPMKPHLMQTPQVKVPKRTSRSRTTRKNFALCILLATATAVIAREYYFHVSAAGPQYASTTIDQDQVNAWNGAQRIAALYLNYTPFSGMFASWDRVQISYHDGQVARFRVQCVACSNRLLFDSRHSTVVPGSKPLSIPMGSVSPGEWHHANLFRDDYPVNDSIWILRETLFWERTGSVEVFEIPQTNSGHYCYHGSFCDSSNSSPVLPDADR